MMSAILGACESILLSFRLSNGRLTRNCRCPLLDSLLRWREHDQGYTDNNKHSRSDQKSYALASDFESLYRHRQGMGEA
jgi:hypothetical protein